VSKAPCASFARVEAFNCHETDLLHPTDHQLGDPISAVDLVRSPGIRIDQYDPNLAAITRVDQSGRVQAGDAVPGGEAAPRENEPSVPNWDSERDPSWDRRTPAAGGQHRVDPGHQVTAGVAGPRVAGRSKLRVQAYELNLEHESAP